MKKRVSCFGMLLFVGYCASAQEVDVLYVRNDSLSKAIAAEVIEANVGQDVSDLEKAPFINVVGSAFEAYWKEKSTKTNLTESKLEKENSRIKIKQETVSAKIQELLERRMYLQRQIVDYTAYQHEIDSIAKANKIETDPKLVSVTDSVSFVEKELKYVNAQLRHKEAELRDSRSVVNGLTADIDALRRQITEKQTALDSYAKGNTPQGRFQETMALLKAGLVKNRPSLNGPLVAINVEELKLLKTKLEGSENLLESLDPTGLAAIKKEMEPISSICLAAEYCQEGIRLMQGKYNMSANSTCASELNKVKPKLSKKHQAECDEIANALLAEESSYKNITRVLNVIEEDYSDGTATETEVVELINSIIKAGLHRNDGQYDEKYVTLNNALSELKRGCNASTLKNGEKVKKLTVNLKAKIKL